MVSPHIKRHEHDMAKRAQAAVSFFVPDSSPMFTYTTDDWTTGYAAQPNGYDQTLHVASASASRVSFNLAATSLTLLVPSFPNCTAIISINSSNPIPACATRSAETATDIPFSLYSLPLGTHEIYWDVGNMPADTEVVFWGLDGSRPAEPSGMVNVTIDNTFAQSSDGEVKLQFEGGWEDVRAGAQTDLTEKDGLDGFYNKTLAVTKQKGSSVAFTGAGSAIYLYGNVGPDYGSASISVNDQVAESSINLTSPWAMEYELLWFRTGLDPTAKTEVVMTNIADSKMALDFVLFTTSTDTIAKINPTPPPPSSFVDSLAGKLVLFFLIPFIVLTLLAIFFFFFVRRRRSRRVKLANDHHRQFSQSSSADFKFPNSESHWSEEPKSSRYSTHSEPSEADLVFVSYEEAKGQRMSEHWMKSASSPPSNDWTHEEEIASLSPRSGRSGMSRSPPMQLRSLPQSIRGSLMPNASILEETAGASGSEQYHGGDEESSDAQSTRNGLPFPPSTPIRYPDSVYPASRRETTGTLPAYTVDDENETPPASAIRTTPGNTFDSAAAEKLQLQIAYSGYATPSDNASPTSPVAGPSRPPTQAQKRMTHTSNAYSITSMFAAPPSDGRQSVPPTPHPPPHIGLPVPPRPPSLPRPPSRFNLSRKPVPGVPTSPRISELPYDGSPNSTKVQPKTSTSPEDQLNQATVPAPSGFQNLQAENGSGGRHGRNRSTGGMSSKTTASAARPDSDIIPFEDFITSLDHSSSNDDDSFGSRR